MSKLRTWLDASITRILLVLALLAAIPLCIFLYKAGQTKQAIDDHPKVLTPKQVNKLQEKVKDLVREKESNQQKADSAYQKTVSPERDAALRQHLIDSLTTAYHAIPTDTSLANPTAVSRYLSTYVPGPDAEL